MTYGQMDANLTSMSSYMRDDGFPNDILTNINPLTLIIFIPVVDYILYPGLRRIGFKMRPITRIVIGFWLGAVAMAYCAIIQVNPPSRLSDGIASPVQIRSLLRQSRRRSKE